MKKRIFKKPNRFVYGVFVLASKFLAKFKYNLKYDKNEFKNIKGPCLILANHEASIDFINLAAALKRRAHFVISNSFYQVNPIKPLLTAAGVIPKNQFQTTMGDMRQIKTAMENNLPLIIYPAGMMTDNGATTPIPLATGKTAKWLNQDLYIAYTSGSYFTHPKWSTKDRKGRITVSIKKLYSKEEMQSLDADTIQKRIEEELFYDAYDNQEKQLVKYKHGDNIEGLETVLYWCPKCNSFHQMKVENKNTLICKVCGNTAIADKYGFLSKGNEESIVYRHPSKWVAKIKELINDEIISNDNYELNDECEIQLINFKKKKFEPAGKGTIRLTKEKIELTGKINNEDISKSFNTNNYPILPFKPNKYLEIQDGKDIYRIVLNNKELTTKWIYSIENLYKIFHNIESKKQPNL